MGSLAPEDGAFDDGHPQGTVGVRKGAVPVYVMLPLDTVSRDGKLQRVDELSQRLGALKRSGVEGVMVDVWWGIVERAGPGHYDWGASLHLVRIVAALDLRLHAVRGLAVQLLNAVEPISFQSASFPNP